VVYRRRIVGGAQVTTDEKWARFTHLYVVVCTWPLGNYTREISDLVAEYYALKKELITAGPVGNNAIV
jgi:hypothetical protein